MARIAGIDLPKNKRMEVALTYIFGIGRSSARSILDEVGIHYDKKVSELTDSDEMKIRGVIERDFKVEGALRTEVAMNIKRLMDIGCYRGIRHRRRLPVHGQRTHTNARTHKGPRVAIAGKKKSKAKK